MSGDGDNRPGAKKEVNIFVYLAVYGSVIVGLSLLAQQCRHRPSRLDNTVCMDGSRTMSTGQGACSWHGGVRGYLPPEPSE